MTHLELSSGIEHFPAFDAFLPTLLSSGMQLLVHNYFPAPARPFVLNLGALDAGLLEGSRAHVRRCLELTDRLGGRFYSVHAAFVLSLTAEVLGRPSAQAELAAPSRLDRDRARAVFVESLRMLSREFAAAERWLLVENNVVSPGNAPVRGSEPFLMTTADDIESILAEVGAPNLGLLLDVGHARVSATALGFDAGEFVRRVRPWVRALHLSDNDGVEHQNHPVRENSWFWPYLRDLNYFDAVIEVNALDATAIPSQLALVRRKLET